MRQLVHRECRRVDRHVSEPAEVQFVCVVQHGFELLGLASAPTGEALAKHLRCRPQASQRQVDLRDLIQVRPVDRVGDSGYHQARGASLGEGARERA